MDKNKTPQEISEDLRDAETIGDDPAKEYKITLDGVRIVEDEYFEDGPFAAFIPAQRELDVIKNSIFKIELAKLIELKRINK